MSEAERLADDLRRQFMNDDYNFDTMIEASIELRRLSAELEKVRKDAERWAHACKGNNKQINVCSWDTDAYEFVGYGMKKEAIDAIADAEIAAMKGTP